MLLYFHKLICVLEIFYWPKTKGINLKGYGKHVSRKYRELTKEQIL